MDSDDELKKSVKQTLDGLTPRERKVLRQRLGIDIPSDLTLDEITKQFHIAREKIRSIEKKALEKLLKEDDSDDLA